MMGRYAIADIAALVGEPTRAAMLLALIDGRALPAGDLAREARLSPAATSLHLGKLAQAGLVVVRQEGRHRYYRLASADVAHALEALGVIATTATRAPAPSSGKATLRVARSCYDHLAGALAVDFTRKMEGERMIRAHGERLFEVTSRGAAWLNELLQIDVSALRVGRRPVARRCLDWTERRDHIAGALGAAILERLLAMRWLSRLDGSRVLRLTARGEERLAACGVAGRAA
jgi:DNA-binding transcriptional ArsR family regulator